VLIVLGLIALALLARRSRRNQGPGFIAGAGILLLLWWMLS
jgi:hypothetical protein